MSWFHWVESVTVERNTVSNKEPKKSALEQAASREAARGELIKRLAEETAMWRKFADGCKPGRWLYSDRMTYSMCEPTLHTTMDEITAASWKDFAQRMAAQAETRLREILG